MSAWANSSTRPSSPPRNQNKPLPHENQDAGTLNTLPDMKAKAKPADKAAANAPPSEHERLIETLKKHPGYKPLSPEAWWRKFTCEDYMRVFGCDKKRRPIRLHRVHAQLRFQDNDPRSADDVATLRTGHELYALKKFDGLALEQFWTFKNPPPSLVGYCRRRWSAYRIARLKAEQHFAKIVWQLDLKDICSPTEARDLHSLFGDGTTGNHLRLSKKLSAQDKALLDDPHRMADFLTGAFWKLADKDREDFLRRTHRRSRLFQSHCREAMRYAAGLISKSNLRLTMLQIFPQFSLDEKLLFMRLCAFRPKAQKKNRLALLCTWLQDNTPVFSKFGWHWEAIYSEAVKNFGEQDLPKSATLLKEYCTRPRGKPRVQLGLKTAPIRIQDQSDTFARPHAKLLTPIPALRFR
jgi:hypothetical protein